MLKKISSSVQKGRQKKKKNGETEKEDRKQPTPKKSQT